MVFLDTVNVINIRHLKVLITELCLFMPLLSDLDCVSWSQQHLSVVNFQSSVYFSTFVSCYCVRLYFMWFVIYTN